MDDFEKKEAFDHLAGTLNKLIKRLEKTEEGRALHVFVYHSYIGFRLYYMGICAVEAPKTS